jgi:hypothetical protein
MRACRVPTTSGTCVCGPWHARSPVRARESGMVVSASQKVTAGFAELPAESLAHLFFPPGTRATSCMCRGLRIAMDRNPSPPTAWLASPAPAPGGCCVRLGHGCRARRRRGEGRLGVVVQSKVVSARADTHTHPPHPPSLSLGSV